MRMRLGGDSGMGIGLTPQFLVNKSHNKEMKTKFSIGDYVRDVHNDSYRIIKIRFDVDGKPIYHGTSDYSYLLFRDEELSLDTKLNKCHN